MEQGIWTREFLISPELCDMDGRLGVLGGLTLFQALAAEHAEQIGVGFAAMARRREFWLTVHCRIELLRPLALMDTVTGETWPEACRAESVRCFRSYRLRRGDEVFAVGRTEWAILGGAGKVVALLLACALVGGASGVGASLLTGSRQTTAQTETAAQSEASANGTTLFEGQRETEALTVAHVDTSRELTAAEVYAENVNSTVGITTSITTNYWGYQTQSAAAGSGFILTADGYILTNYHVVEDSNSITVSLYDGSSYDAKLIGYDENNDIAVLKIDATGLQPVVLGSSDDLHVGDQVVAIGNPLGDRKYGLGEAGGIALWSCRIGLFHPESGMWMTFSHAPNGIPQFSDFEDCFSNAVDV